MRQKVSPIKLFAIFSLRLRIFRWNFAVLLPIYPQIFTHLNFGLFTLIFSKMALEYLSFLPFQVSSFTKSNCRNFTADVEWPPSHQAQSTGLSGLGTMLEWVLSQATTESKLFQSLKIHSSRLGLPYRRKPLTTQWNTTANDYRAQACDVCKPVVDILNISCDDSYIIQGGPKKPDHF